MIVVAYYTINTPYEEEVKNLIQSLEAHNMRYCIEGVHNRGSWELNCGIKPEYIKEMLIRHPDDNIFYVDADAVIARPFSLDIDADISVTYLGNELLSGSIYLRNRPSTRKLIQLWINEQQANPGTWDQKNLQAVVDREKPDLFQLPPEYTKIFDRKMCDVEPYVIHNQASRRFKSFIREEVMTPRTDVPRSFDGIRVRMGADGSFALPRCNKALEQRLNGEYQRCPGEFRWFPHCLPGKELDELRPMFLGKKCYFVGKGPSLDNVDESIFAPGVPIICVNESIHKVETLNITNPLFVIQQDGNLRKTCLPKRATLLVSKSCQAYYPEVTNKYVLEYNNCALTVIKAIEFARELGSVGGTLVGFDSCVTKDTGYAKCIGYGSEKGGVPGRFLKHRRLIDKATFGYPTEYITPEQVTPSPQADTSSDSSWLSLDSPPEHRVSTHQED